MSTPKHHGGCLCGDITIAVHQDPKLQLVCHCTDCQQESGGAFLCHVSFPVGSVKVTKGTPTVYDDVKPSGNHVIHHFCGRCGSTIWTTLEVHGGLDSLALGTLSGPNGSGTAFFKPTSELFVSSRQQWLKDVEGATQWKQGPQA